MPSHINALSLDILLYILVPMKTGTSRILIADDQKDVLEALRLLLKGEGYQIEAVNSPAGIMNLLESDDFDVVLMDLNYKRDTSSGEVDVDQLERLPRC